MSSLVWFENPKMGLVKSVRPTQVAMVRDVIEPIYNEGGVGGAQAETGVGKTLAYTVPAVIKGFRLIISTGKKSLQEQIVKRELPRIAALIKPALKFALLKGKANYACKLRFEEFKDGGESAKYNEYHIRQFEKWLKTDHTGDLEGYPNSDELMFGQHVKINECIRAQCPHFTTCGYIRAKLDASEAEVLVVNHALAAYDLILGGGKILGPAEALVIDEAHHAPKFFRDACSLSMYPKQVDMLERMTSGDMTIQMPGAIKQLYSQIFSRIPLQGGRFDPDPGVKDLFATLYREWDGMKKQFAKQNLMPEDREGIVTQQQFKEVVDEHGFVGLERVQTSAIQQKLATHKSRLVSAASFVLNQMDFCSIMIGEEPKEGEFLKGDRTDFLRFVDKSQDEHAFNPIELKISPVDIGPMIAPGLLHIGKVILTSATLTPTANAWSSVTQDFGLAESQLEPKLTFESSFDYKTNSAMYFSTTAPEWPEVKSAEAKDRYYSLMTREIHELLCASEGRAFIICPSKDERDEYFTRLGNLTGPYVLLKQSPRVDQDVDEYRHTPGAVLVGTQGIGEGIDLPGTDMLRLVIIPRFPFPAPTDYILQTKSDRYAARKREEGCDDRSAGVKAWMRYSFTAMMILLKQWVGRLIRSEADRGVVAILDSRVFKNRKGKPSSYGSTIRESFPHPKYVEKEPILKFLTILTRCS